MRSEKRLVAFSAALGLLMWAVDGALDYLVFHRGATLWDSLFFDLDAAEVFMRSMMVAGFVTIGLITWRLLVIRRRAQETLAASEERLATTLQSIGDAVIATDADTRITFVNPTAQHLTGWSSDDAVGRKLDEIFRIVDGQTEVGLAPPVGEVLRSGTVAEMADDTTLITKDGTRRSIADSAAPIKDKTGRVIGAVLVFRNVTEHREVVEALQREKELAQKYLSIAGAIIVALDAQGNVTLINRKGCDLFGWEEQDVLGKNWFEHFLPEHLRQPSRVVFSQLMAGEIGAAAAEYHENPVLTRTGEERIIAWHNTVVTDEKGTIVGTLSSGEDITERLPTFTSLQQSEERFRAVFTAAEDCIFIKDRELRYTHINPSMERLLGIKASSVVGRPTEKQVGIGLGEHAREMDFRVLNGETVEDEITRPINAVPTTFHLIRMPLRDGSGAITGLCGIARNITHRKRIEDALRDNEARLQRQNAALAKLDMRRLFSGGDLVSAVRKITEAAADALQVERLGVWLYTEDRTKIRCIDQYERSKEAHTDGVELMVHEYPAYFSALDASRTIATPDARADPRTREFTDGYLVPLGITSIMDAPVRVGKHIAGIVCSEHTGPPRQWAMDEQNFAGSMADLVALALQISERGRIQEALLQSEEWFRDVTFSTADWIWEVNAEGVYTYCSSRIEDFLGYSAEEVLGRTPFDFMPADERERVGEIFAGIASRRESIRDLENRNIHKDGRIVHLLTNGVPIIDRHGTFMGYRGCDRDITKRKRAQEILQQRQDRATTILEAVEEGIYFVDAEDNVEYANPVMVGQFGPFAGKKCYEYCDGRDSACPWCKLEAARAGKTERWRWHSSTARRTFNVLAAPVSEAMGSRSVLIVLTGVTEHGRKEQTIRDSRKLVDQIFRESLDVLMIIGEDGNIWKVSDAARHVLGFEPHELVGMDVAALLPEQSGVTPDELLARLRIYGGVFAELPIRRADGSVCRMDLTATIIPWDQGKAILVTFRDATERQVDEEALRESENTARALINASTDIAILTDVNGVVLAANEAAARRVNRSVAELLGVNLSESFPVVITAGRRARIAEVVNSRNPVRFEDERDGHHFDTSIFPVLDALGHVIRLAIFSHDITERKRSEQIRSALFEIAEATNLTDNLGDLLKTIHEVLGRLIDTTNFYVALYDPKQNTYTFPYFVDQYDEPIFTPVQLKKSLTDYVRRTGQPLIVDEATSRTLEEQGAVAVVGTPSPIWLGAPLKTAQGTIGVVVVQSYSDPHCYTVADLDLLTFVSGHIAMAIERKRAEEELRRSEERYRTIIDNTFDLVYSYAGNGTITFVGQQVAHFGYTPEEIIGRNISEFIHPDNLELVLRELGKVIRTEEVPPLEFRLRGKDGTEHHVEAMGHAVLNNGRLIEFMGVIREITEQKLAEQAHRESEERFRTLVENQGEGIGIVDPQERFAFANPAAELLFGIPPGGLVGRTLQEFMTPEQFAYIQEQTKLRCTGEKSVYELEITRPDGEKRDLLVTATTQFDADHRFAGVFGIFRDITERKRAEEALRESEEKYRHLIEDSIEGIGISQGNRVVFANGALLKIFGYDSLEEFARVPLLDSVAPESRSMILEIMKKKERGEIAQPYFDHFEYKIIRKDGTIRDVEIQVSETAINNEILIQSTFRDITERKRAEEEVQKLASVVRHSSELVNLATLDGKMLFLNEAGAEMLGIDVEAVEQVHIMQIIPKHLQEKVQTEVLPALITHGAWEGDLQYLNLKTGELTDVNAMTFTVTDPNTGAPLYLANVSHDITARKHAEEALRHSEEQLRQSQKMEAVGQLAGGVAHDFNNLLSIITGHSELLLHRLASDDQLVHNVQEINDAGQRAANLTRQLLTFSRKQVLEPRVLNLNTIVANVDNMLRRLIGENISLIMASKPELGAVRADPGQIEQVLMNLVVNARDALPRGGIITIETSNVDIDLAHAHEHPEAALGPHVMLSVSDTGHGMDAQVKAHIFEPFFTTKDEGKGTGLGLSTVYGIVKQSDGHILVDSEPGAGTTFRIYLPRVEASAKGVMSTRTQGPVPRGRETILVVEDEPGVRELARDALRAQGYAVMAADDGVAALQISDRHNGPIHLLLTDIVMPFMSGLDLVERLAPQRPDMKVMYMSGYTDHAVVLGGATEQGGAFLQKPFALDHLCRMVRAALDGKSEAAQATPAQVNMP